MWVQSILTTGTIVFIGEVNGRCKPYVPLGYIRLDWSKCSVSSEYQHRAGLRDLDNVMTVNCRTQYDNT